MQVVVTALPTTFFFALADLLNAACGCDFNLNILRNALVLGYNPAAYTIIRCIILVAVRHESYDVDSETGEKTLTMYSVFSYSEGVDGMQQVDTYDADGNLISSRSGM